MKPAAAAVVSGGSVAAIAAITSSDVSEWLAIIERVSESKAGLLVLCLLMLVGLIYLLARQWSAGNQCDERVRQLESVVQGMYALLATDDRYPDLPPYEDFAAGRFSLHALHRSRSTAAYSRPNEGESR